MKQKTKITVCTVLGVLLLLAVAIAFLRAEEQKRREAFCEQVCAWVEEKYNRPVQYIQYGSDYRGAPAALVYFEDEPDVPFWAYEFHRDYYYETHLNLEAERMLKDVFPELKKVVVDFYWPAFGEDETVAERFYMEHGRAIRFSDEECRVAIQSFWIYSNIEMEESERYDMMEEIIELFGRHIGEHTHFRFGEGDYCCVNEGGKITIVKR